MQRVPNDVVLDLEKIAAFVDLLTDRVDVERVAGKQLVETGQASLQIAHRGFEGVESRADRGCPDPAEHRACESSRSEPRPARRHRSLLLTGSSGPPAPRHGSVAVRRRPEIRVTITYRLLGQPVAGRLGNQLWEIASTIGIAHRRGERAGFPFWRYAPYFSVPPELFPDLAAVDGEDLGLDYLQDLRHLDGVEDTVRAYFAPRPELRERIERRNAALLALPHRTSVHVRRGDYLLHPREFPALPLSYYREAMALLPPPYLVFSDDLPWCRSHFPAESCVFMEHNRNYEDLFLITMCDAHITSNSTMSWWGAWLGAGPAVYPRMWYGPTSAQLDPTLFLPADGIILDSQPSND